MNSVGSHFFHPFSAVPIHSLVFRRSKKITFIVVYCATRCEIVYQRTFTLDNATVVLFSYFLPRCHRRSDAIGPSSSLVPFESEDSAGTGRRWFKKAQRPFGDASNGTEIKLQTRRVEAFLATVFYVSLREEWSATIRQSTYRGAVQLNDYLRSESAGRRTEFHREEDRISRRALDVSLSRICIHRRG